MLTNYGALADIPAGEALPFLAEVDGEPHPVLIGVVECRPPGDKWDTGLFCSTALGTPGGPSVRLAVGLWPPSVPVFGSQPEPPGAPLCVIEAWLNPASEDHLAWLNLALRVGGLAVEVVTPAEIAAGLRGERAAQSVRLQPALARKLGDGFYQAMRHATELPWASLDFRASCLAHAAGHPLAGVFA